jgi:TRAP-type C4-dicarboxylate transport system permease large subunit
VLESLPITIILTPILEPIAYTAGVEPINFAVIFLVGGPIGFITSTYGLSLYVASGINNISYFQIVKHVLLYLYFLKDGLGTNSFLATIVDLPRAVFGVIVICKQRDSLTENRFLQC